jgi:integrase
MEAAPGPDERFAIALAAYAGLRHSEIAHLEWDDLANGTVHVRAKNGWSPKSHADRIVPMGPKLRAAYWQHASRRLRLGGRDGSLFSVCDFTDGVRTAFQRAGLYNPEHKSGLHALRRTYASFLLGSGVDVETVRELGGWADLKTVQRYLASTDDLKRAAVENL